MWPALGAAIAQSAGDMTGGIVNGFWNLRNEHQQSDMANLNAMHNLNAMTYQAYLQQMQSATSHEYQKELLSQQAFYNSPEYLMQSAIKAGLNPAVAFGKGQSVNAGSAPSVPQGSVGLASVNAPGRPYFPFEQSGIGELASAVKAFADAKRTGIESDFLPRQLEELIKGQELQNELVQMNNELTRIFGNQERASELTLKYAHAYQLLQQGDKDGALKLYAEAQTATEREVARLNKVQADKLESEREYWDKMWRANLQKTSSEAQMNFAEAKTEDTLREGRKNVLEADARAQNASAAAQEFINDVNDLVGKVDTAVGKEHEYKLKELESKMQSLEYEEAEQVKDYIIKQAEIAVKKHDYKSWYFYEDLIKQLFGVAGQAAILVTTRGKAMPKKQ